MKYLLHGDDVTASRIFLQGITEGYPTTNLDGKTLTVSQLEEAVSSPGLFAEKKAVVVENLISKNSKKKEITTWINNWNGTVLLVLWEEKKLTKLQIGMVKNAQLQEFLLPTYYFQFLDSLVPQQKKRVFTLYQELLKSYAPEQLLFSLLKRIRLLVVIKSNSSTEELSKMPDWMRSKLQQQARLWNDKTLVAFYKKLQEAEIMLKTGRLPVDLSKHLDILILSGL